MQLRKPDATVQGKINGSEILDLFTQTFKINLWRVVTERIFNPTPLETYNPFQMHWIRTFKGFYEVFFVFCVYIFKLLC